MKPLRKRILLGLTAFITLCVVTTVIVNLWVERSAGDRIYNDVSSVPHNRVALLLGTNPLNRSGRPNTYFTKRIQLAAELYHTGKVDCIIASGDNHTESYDEPTAMRDSLIAMGVPESRIVLDCAGFRTLDSVVRAKEVFGCDSLTIVSQADHCARALFLAGANGIEAVAVAAPVVAGRKVRIRLALREWLARDKMMLDLLFGRRPHFLGEKIEIADLPEQKSYSTNPEVTVSILNLEDFHGRQDSLVIRFQNNSDYEVTYGEWFEIQKSEDGRWIEADWDEQYKNTDSVAYVVFHDIGYGLSPHSVSSQPKVIRPWFYKLPSGRYRLAKKFRSASNSSREVPDTAYVEFDLPGCCISAGASI